MPDRTIALIVAAGAGRRLDAPLPKAFMVLAGKPILEYSLGVFDAHDVIDGIVVVVPEGMTREAGRLAARFTRVRSIVEGGPRRQDSVLSGLSCIGPEVPPEAIVLVHDAARPLVDPGIVTSVRNAAARTGAAVPGIRPADTIRRIADGGMSIERLDRDRLVLVQTPQGFRIGLLREAFARAAGNEVTDDAALVEAMGRPVEIVAGSRRNLKVTTPEDLRSAEALLA